MLFDFGDIIPLKDKCLTHIEWGDLSNTARATRDAFMKALNGWYLSTTTCLTVGDECYNTIKTYWDRVNDFYNNEYMVIFEEFWDSLTDPNKTFSDEICSRYRKMMIDWRCMIKGLLRLVDGDFGGLYTKSWYE